MSRVSRALCFSAVGLLLAAAIGLSGSTAQASKPSRPCASGILKVEPRLDDNDPRDLKMSGWAQISNCRGAVHHVRLTLWNYFDGAKHSAGNSTYYVPIREKNATFWTSVAQTSYHLACGNLNDEWYVEAAIYRSNGQQIGKSKFSTVVNGGIC